MAEPFFILKGISRKNAAQHKTKYALIQVKYNCPDGGRYVRTTGEKIQVQHWSFKNSSARSSYTEIDKDGKVVDAQRFNDQLKALAAQITDAVREMRSQNIAITKETLTKFLEEQKQENTEKIIERLTLLEFIDKFIEECEQGLYKDINSKNTIKNFKTARTILKEYHKKNGGVVFSNINRRFYLNFESYLRLTYKSQSKKARNRGKGIKTNTVGTIIAKMKTFLTRASQDDRCDFNFPEELKKQFIAETEEIDAISLTEAQLRLIYEADLSDQPMYLQRERDAFVLISWLGLRDEDSKRIHPERIIETERGYFIKIRAHKTWKSNKEVIIPLHPWAHEILKKYDYHHPHPISNQKANTYIKEVLRIVGLTQPVTHTYTRGGSQVEETRPLCDWAGTHTRRRFFATTWIRPPYKVDPLIVRMVGGWKSERQFLKYVRLTPEEWAELLMDKIAESGAFLKIA